MNAPSPSGSVATFVRVAWGFCGYLLLVILFGAFVRITHSGAGCGSHWPTCHGEIVPTDPSVETLIEFSHRTTSGALGLFGLGLVIYAARRFGRHRVTWAACVTLAFIVIEALIGAGLVLQELVADDDSVSRAVVISLHLVNTLMLTGSAVLVPFWARRDAPLRPSRAGSARVLAPTVLVVLILTSMSGAVTALGDTLFPVDPTVQDGLFARVRDDLSPARHFLVRLRIFHPALAVAAAAVVFYLTARLRESARSPHTARLARATAHAVALQVIVGALNIYLAAPAIMQLVHLLLAQVVWMVAVLTTASAFSDPAPAGPRPAGAPGAPAS